jgi:hypothetical protein
VLVNGGAQGTISGGANPIMRFLGSKPGYFRNASRKSPLIMFRWQELIVPPVAGAVAQAMRPQITYVLTYMDFTKQTQFSPDIKERPPDGANRLTESVAANGEDYPPPKSRRLLTAAAFFKPVRKPIPALEVERTLPRKG